MHRQENLMDKKFFKDVLCRVKDNSKKMKCVIILHKITELALKEMGMYDELKADSNFVLLPRVDYFDFMKLLQASEYVITDGGSNQEELHYMGKPCLIMRKTTERNEGIGENAILFGGDVSWVSRFAESYKDYERKDVEYEVSPSEIISEYLLRN